jgi:hypothetical protein
MWLCKRKSIEKMDKCPSEKKKKRKKIIIKIAHVLLQSS